jgi:hypothetical protein
MSRCLKDFSSSVLPRFTPGGQVAAATRALAASVLVGAAALSFILVAAVAATRCQAGDPPLRFPPDVSAVDVENLRWAAAPGLAPRRDGSATVAPEPSDATAPGVESPVGNSAANANAAKKAPAKRAAASVSMAATAKPAELLDPTAEAVKILKSGAKSKAAAHASATGDPSAAPAKAETQPEPNTQGKSPAPAAAAETETKRELNAEQIALRDRVRSTLNSYFQSTLNTRDNTVGDVLQACLAYGCRTEIYQGSEKINGITCLCWNYSCGGHEPLMLSGGHICGRIGYAQQSNPAQLLAVLALSRVPGSYPVRVGEMVRDVTDLVKFEQGECRAGTDQSLRLIGLAHYVPLGATWTNQMGESWSVERIVRDELAQPVVESSAAGTNRLLGLSCAVVQLARNADRSVDVQRAQKFIRDYQEFAFRVQNSDGSWNPQYFAAMGTSNDWSGALSATGHVLEWLVVSLSDAQLEDPQVVKSVEYLSRLLAGQYNRWNVAALDARSLDGVMHALHALGAYDERVFKPCDGQEPAAVPSSAASVSR